MNSISLPGPIYDSPQSYILTHANQAGITMGFTRRATLFLLTNGDYCTLDHLKRAQNRAQKENKTIIDTPHLTAK